MASGRGTPEYQTIQTLTSVLRLAVRSDLLSLGGQLLAYGLISPDNEDSLRNMMFPEGQRAATCVDLISKKVEEDAQNYHTFVRVLQTDAFQYKSILSKLQQTYIKFRQQAQQVAASPVRVPQPSTTTAVPPASGSSSAAYVALSTKPVRVSPPPTAQVTSPPVNNKTHGASNDFDSSMTEDDFVGFLKNEGLSCKDCEIMRDKGITAKTFSTDFCADEVNNPDFGFTFGGKKVLTRLLQKVSTRTNRKVSAPKTPDSAVNNQRQSASESKKQVKPVDTYEPFGSRRRIMRFTFGNVEVMAGEMVSNIETYEMNRFPHGIALIINNESFSNQLGTRTGTVKDEGNLCNTFRYLGYKVEIYRDVDSNSMLTVMDNMASRNHGEYDSFVCCILSHGKEGAVYGVDEKEVPVNDIAEKFDAKHCRSLCHKPKLFFIQACRGEFTEEAVPVQEVHSDSAHEPKRKVDNIPHVCDFFFSYATPRGYQAWRDNNHGSWYISELCRTLYQMGSYASLNDMMTKVCKRVAASDKYEYLGQKMTPEITNRLTKNVFFPHCAQQTAKAQ